MQNIITQIKNFYGQKYVKAEKLIITEKMLLRYITESNIMEIPDPMGHTRIKTLFGLNVKVIMGSEVDYFVLE